jgi:hypothetical protein
MYQFCFNVYIFFCFLFIIMIKKNNLTCFVFEHLSAKSNSKKRTGTSSSTINSSFIVYLLIFLNENLYYKDKLTIFLSYHFSKRKTENYIAANIHVKNYGKVRRNMRKYG